MINDERKEAIYNCIVTLVDIIDNDVDISDFIHNICVECGEKLILILKIL